MRVSDVRRSHASPNRGGQRSKVSSSGRDDVLRGHGGEEFTGHHGPWDGDDISIYYIDIPIFFKKI